ncbi:MAG: hypothetical protein JWM58_200 [Rhizobium sp.]|nr:hypothetical protein [Rhizobium sp.]
MPTPENHLDASTEAQTVPQDGASMPVEFIELGLGLEMLLDTHPAFMDAVKAAILPLDGEFLFELPYGEKPDGKGRVAAVRLAYAGDDEPRVAFVFLLDDGMETSIEASEGQPEHLRNFAESFVNVLEKIGRH